MIRICIVVTVPVTVKSFFVSQLKYLSNNGYDVTVVCGSDEELQEMLGSKIKLEPIDFPRGISIVGSVQSIVKLKRYFSKSKFDMVQYSTPNASLYASIVSKLSKVPVRIYHLMGYKYLGTTGFLRLILKTFERISCGLSTHVECVSQSNLQLGFDEKFFKKKKATVVGFGSTGGVDLIKFDIKKKELWRKNKREKLGILDDDIVLGFCGRITKDKGIDELFQAFLNLRVDSDIKLLVVGDFENEEDLNQVVLETIRNDEYVVFQPYSQNVEEYFAIIDVLVLPSYREGFGNVIIEAAAMGIPTVASNISGPSDAIIDNQTGILHEAKNFNDLEIKLRNLVFNIHLLNKLGINAYNHAVKYFSSDILNEAILKQKNLYYKD